jgi:hypothetical protein
MYDYESLKISHGKEVPQTVDAPILVFDMFEIRDVFISLMIILIFGIVFFSWWTMTFLLILFLGVNPIIKKKNERGIFFHYPYKVLHMSLPGIFNPKGRRRFSD